MSFFWKYWHKYKSVVAYLFWGVVTTILSIAVFMGCIAIGWNYQIGNVLGWIAAVSVAYITNKLWVFYSPFLGTKETLSEVSRFFFYRIITLIMDVVITYIGISFLKWDAFLVKVLDNIVVIVINYVFSKWLIFKRKKNEKF